MDLRLVGWTKLEDDVGIVEETVEISLDPMKIFTSLDPMKIFTKFDEVSSDLAHVRSYIVSGSVEIEF